jgi:protein gp37
MAQTKIEWAEKVWNPITGCSPVSEGCENCYARKMANRLKGRYGYPEKDPFRVTIHAEKFIEPISWRKHQFVFVCSMGDLFHDDVSSEIIQIVFDRMAFFDQHTYLILTKRPHRMLDEIMEWERYCNQVGLPFPTSNVWLGVSVENQKTYDERTLILSRIECAYRFISFEPLLGPIIGNFLDWRCDWAICGGETGPKVRPMHPDWVKSLRDQCQTARIPFFFKAWGEWIPKLNWPDSLTQVSGLPKPVKWGTLDIEGNWFLFTTPWNGRQGEDSETREYVMIRTGKKKAGRLLDGRTWEERPE